MRSKATPKTERGWRLYRDYELRLEGGKWYVYSAGHLVTGSDDTLAGARQRVDALWSKRDRHDGPR